MARTLKVPFSLDGNKVGVVTDYVDIAKQKIITTLMTTPPERLHLPAFGVGTPAWVMDSIDDLSDQDYATDAALEISGRVSGVTIHRIFMNRLDVTTVQVEVHFSAGYSAIQTVSVKIDAGSLITEDTPL